MKFKHLMSEKTVLSAYYKYSEISKKGNPLDWKSTLYLDIPYQKLSECVKVFDKMNMGTVNQLREEPALDRPIIYDYEGKYFLLYGVNELYLAMENKMLFVPVVIISNRYSKWSIENNDLIPNETRRAYVQKQEDSPAKLSALSRFQETADRIGFAAEPIGDDDNAEGDLDTARNCNEVLTGISFTNAWEWDRKLSKAAK